MKTWTAKEARKWFFEIVWKGLQKAGSFIKKTFQTAGSITRKILIGLAILVAILISLLMVKVVAWILGWSFTSVAGVFFNWNVVWFLVGIVGLLVVAKLIQGGSLPHISLGGAGGKFGKLAGSVKHFPWKKFFLWVMIETMALAIICRYWVISGNTLLAFAKDWWLIVVPAHIIAGFFILKSSHGHSSHGGGHGHGHGSSPMESIKAVLSVGIMVSVIMILSQFGGCIGRMNNPDYAMPQAVVNSPLPQFNPGDIRMGTWEELVPPGGQSPWIIFHKGVKTSAMVSFPAKYLKGKLVGKDVVIYDMPLKWDRPNDPPFGMAGDEAIRYFNENANVLKITITRGRP